MGKLLLCPETRSIGYNVRTQGPRYESNVNLHLILSQGFALKAVQNIQFDPGACAHTIKNCAASAGSRWYHQQRIASA